MGPTPHILLNTCKLITYLNTKFFIYDVFQGIFSLYVYDIFIHIFDFFQHVMYNILNDIN